MEIPLLQGWPCAPPVRVDVHPGGQPRPSRESAAHYRHSREGGNPEGWQRVANDLQTIPATRPPFSYLGVPAPAGMSDCYESMSRTPIRDVPSNQPRCRPSTGRNRAEPKTDGRCRNERGRSVARGLVPRWGRGGAWQNPPRQFAAPNHNSGFSYPWRSQRAEP